MTLVPLKLYFNERGRVKLEIALARGKNFMISVKQKNVIGDVKKQDF